MPPPPQPEVADGLTSSEMSCSRFTRASGVGYYFIRWLFPTPRRSSFESPLTILERASKQAIVIVQVFVCVLIAKSSRMLPEIGVYCSCSFFYNDEQRE